MKRLLLYGVGGLIVLAAIGQLAQGSPSDGEPAGTNNTVATKPHSGPIQAHVGTPVTIGGLEINITKAQHSRGGEFLKPAEGHIWIAYNISLKAVDGNKFISTSDWTALSDGDRQGKWTITGEGEWRPILSMDEVRQGATVSGWLVFEVPQPNEYVRLVYDPSFFSDEARLVLDAKVN